ncbi:MAG: ATP-dependent RNA helicase RhlE [Flavobacteriales bacterium]|jgi:ATP-dependent RNA helicase RhlE|tara:strand:- start:156 stop:1391 length:1236 start_codon:yes stop_codon:yes gene_type:complete
MKFSEYNFTPEIIKNLEMMGFKKPTDIQYKSIPAIVKGEDLLAIAQTGTGKTAAFAIPIINYIQRKKKNNKENVIRALVMVPTRELAQQIAEVFNKLGKGTKVKTLALYGGVEQESQIDRLLSGVDVLVTTPGRMFDLHNQEYVNLDKVNTLVLDEADHMLDLGFIKDIEDVIARMPKMKQTLFFSATINKKIKKIAYDLIRSNAIRIQIAPKDPVSRNIKHSVAFIKMDDKRFFLERLIKENTDKKILVFVRTKVRAERVKKAMDRVEVVSETIHGDKEQKARTSVMGKFRTGEIKILIATDVSARGIDIANVDYVVNYDMPDVAENYVHRIGRTGRGRLKGDAVSFCAKEEKPLLKEIEDFVGKPIKVLELQQNEYRKTIDFSEDTNLSIKELMGQIEDIDKKVKRKKK